MEASLATDPLEIGRLLEEGYGDGEQLWLQISSRPSGQVAEATEQPQGRARGAERFNLKTCKRLGWRLGARWRRGTATASGRGGLFVVAPTPALLARLGGLAASFWQLVWPPAVGAARAVGGTGACTGRLALLSPSPAARPASLRSAPLPARVCTQVAPSLAHRSTGSLGCSGRHPCSGYWHAHFCTLPQQRCACSAAASPRASASGVSSRASWAARSRLPHNPTCSTAPDPPLHRQQPALLERTAGQRRARHRRT